MNLHSLYRSLLLTAVGVLLALHSVPAHAKAIEGVVNINTASVQELTLLPGIGKAKAEQIVQMRQAKPFASAEDLKAIQGIGGKRLEAMLPHIVLNGPTTAKKVATQKQSVQGGNEKSSSSPSPKI